MVRHFADPREGEALAAAFWPERVCPICLKPLDVGPWVPRRKRPRKVHAERCARVRKSQLQRLRRWRALR